MHARGLWVQDERNAVTKELEELHGETGELRTFSEGRAAEQGQELERLKRAHMETTLELAAAKAAAADEGWPLPSAGSPGGSPAASPPSHALR